MYTSWLLLLPLIWGSVLASQHPRPHLRRARQGGVIVQQGSQSSSSLPASPSASGTTSGGGNGGGGGGNVQIPGNCYKLPNGLAVGVEADESAQGILSSVTNKPPCFYGKYATITGISGGKAVYSGSLNAGVQDANAVGAVYVLTIKPAPGVSFDSITGAAQQIATDVNNVANSVQGQLYLRFVHEVNWFIIKDPQYTGDGPSYKKMFAAVAGAVNRDKVKMWWCPNPPSSTGQSSQQLKDQFYPGDSAVDIVGIDAYAQHPTDTFSMGVPNDFCTLFSSKDLILGETGYGNGGTTQERANWLTQVATNGCSCKNYKGFLWFEIGPKGGEGDFRVFDNGIAAGVLKGNLPTCSASQNTQ